MNYELAKELKEAGFPQDAIYGTAFYNEQAVRLVIDENIEGLHWPSYMRCPTLSELIEACGKIPFRLQSYYSGNGIGWRADTCGNFRDWNNEIDKGEFGYTPDEAVAKLWLALNPKV